MPSGKENKSGALARAVSSEIRATMARQRISGTTLSTSTGISNNYLAKRLRDEVPFTLNDIDRICAALHISAEGLITHAAEVARRRAASHEGENQ